MVNPGYASVKRVILMSLGSTVFRLKIEIINYRDVLLASLGGFSLGRPTNLLDDPMRTEDHRGLCMGGGKESRIHNGQ